MYPTPCIHRCGCGGLCDSCQPCPMADNAPSLCPKCQAEFDEDTSAYEEFGEHPDGQQRWRQLREEMATEADEGCSPEDWDGIPF